MKEELNQSNFFEKSPIKEVYLLLGVNNNTDRSNNVWLSNLYTEEDQKLFPEFWDYNNPELITNKVKNILEKVGEVGLSEQEKKNRNEILWFWYHHAISIAIARYKDIEKAKFYSSEALKYQSKSKDHPNFITKILDLLLHDKLQEAEELAKNVEPDEQVGATHAIQSYKNNWEGF